MYKALVPDMRSNNPNINAAFCRKNKCGKHAVINNQIGGGYVNIVFCGADNLKVNMFADILTVHGAVSIRLNKSVVIFLTGGLAPGIILCVIFVCAGAHFPHLQEHKSKTPRGAPFYHNGRIFPMAMLFICVDIFVSQVYSSREYGFSVYGGNFSVVTVVLNSREHRTKRVENNTFYTVLFKLSGVIARQKEKTAEIVIHDADGNAICRLALKNIQNRVPHIAFLNNKIFKKNIFFRFFKLR